jgi:alpha-L-fucosidase 2
MNTILRYSKPETEWIKGLPLGNGRIGMMTYGEPGSEILAFNADSLYRHNAKKRLRVSECLEEFRNLTLEKKGKEAHELLNEHIYGQSEAVNAYQPFHDLILEVENAGKEYQRELNLSEAVVSVSYKSNTGAAVKWESFVSTPAQLIVFRLTADKPVNASIRYARPAQNDCSWETEKHGDKGFVFSGALCEGIGFYSALRIMTDGKLEFRKNKAVFNGIREIEFRAALGTSLEYADPLNEVLKVFDLKEDYTALQAAHIKHFKSLFERANLSFGEEDSRTSEEIYDIASEGVPWNSREGEKNVPPSEPPKTIYRQLFDMARYAFISSSQPGALPINLQGLWCHDTEPMWSCTYTTDMNIQMSYWIANRLRLGECEEPLFEWVCGNEDTMERQCREIFGIPNSCYIPQYTDVFMTPSSELIYSDFQIFWSGGAAWISRHFFEHWKYTGDDDFGRRKAYPYLKGCAYFYIALLRKHEDGRYHLVPSFTPENWTSEGDMAVETAVMDISIIHDLMSNLIELHDALKMDEEDDRRKWEEIIEFLPDYPLDADGALREWLDSRIPKDPYHRHIAHLYGLHPSNEFADHGVYAKAAEKALEKRLENGVGNMAGWSLAWSACFWARLCNGGKALYYIDCLIKGMLLPNLLTTHNDWRQKPGYFSWGPVFQIEALFGAASAICEMLIQERNDEVLLLPALPERLASRGSVSGFGLYHRVTADFVWKEGVVVRLALVSPINQKIYIRKNGRFTPKPSPSICDEDNRRFGVMLKANTELVLNG